MKGLEEIRSEAARRFAERGFPTPREEEWRFTNVAPIAKLNFAPAEDAGRGLDDELRAELERLGWGGLRLVFVDGRYVPELSSARLPLGIVAGPLAGANGTAARHLARYAAYQEHPFVAWNTASFRDGAFLEVAPGTALEEPVELVYLSTRAEWPVVSHPRSLVVAGRASQLTLVEVYAGCGADYLSNAVTEIVAAEGAVVDHYKLELEDTAAFHVGTVQVQAARDVNLSTCAVSLGGKLVRNEVNTVLGQGSSATLNGLYVISGTQHVDNRTVVDHAEPNGTSFELYKGILDGRASGVFNGKIIVRQPAQKTDAKQTNKNLILSKEAVINTKPELRIFADDVRCTHGATIGQIDREAVFYLTSRGIGEGDAREMLTLAFARDILDRIRLEPLRSWLDARLWEKFHGHGG
jgi:Fe-S cluster assembly protein SufD